MLKFGIFNTLVVDELNSEVSYGPPPQGDWIRIGGWGEREWQVLVAIASHPRGAQWADRRIVYRIRERFRRADGVPPQYADEIIVTRKASSTFVLHPRISARFLPARIYGAGEHNEPRAMDSMIRAVKHAGIELFGASAFRDAIALLPDETRRDTHELRHAVGRWVPVRYVTHWMRAVFDGPARQSQDAYAHFVRLVESYRLSPHFAEYIQCRETRLSDIKHMWRTCYDSGDFEAHLGSKNEFLELRLWNHPFCQSERAARVFALCWRALSEVFGASEPRIEACEFESLSGALRIRIGGTFVAGP